MKDSAMASFERQLELLLEELLREPASESGESTERPTPPSELAELREVARRLHQAGQGLPRSVRAGLVRAAQHSVHGHSGALCGNERVTHRQRSLVVWWGIATAVLMVALGFAAAQQTVPPSSPWYGVRIAVENLQVALVPSSMARAYMLVRNAHTRIGEIQAMAAMGDTTGLRRAADALDADAGWLHAVLETLPAQERRDVVRGLKKV